MVKANIVTNDDFISYFFFFPILVNKKRLRKLGLSFKYFDRIDKRVFDCDILLLDSKFFKPRWNDRDQAMDLLKTIRDKSNYLVWLDTTDSTGTTHFQVLPYVDQYWKKQLLKDTSLYEKRYYGARIYTEYYKDRYHLRPEKVHSAEPLKREEMHKLVLSWNLGAGPILSNRRLSNLLRQVPWSIKERLLFTYSTTRVSPSLKRRNTVTFKGTDKYTNYSLSFQRIKTIEMLKGIGINTTPIPLKGYMKELRASRVGVSPFGAGEVCFRDFEFILNGTLLYKPAMNHLITYPDVYKENETYVPYKWDFSNFYERLNELTYDTEQVERISTEAQRNYTHFLSDEGQKEFCDLLANKMNRIQGG